MSFVALQLMLFYRKLEGDARKASVAVTFVLVIIMVSVLCTRMWRKNKYLPPADHSHSSDIKSFSVTASGWLVYPTRRKFSLDYKFCYFTISKFAKFKPHKLFELCGFPNDSIYKRTYNTKIQNLSVLG